MSDALIQINVRVPPDIRRWLAAKSGSTEVSQNRIVIRALRNEMARDAQTPVQAGMSRSAS